MKMSKFESCVNFLLCINLPWWRLQTGAKREKNSFFAKEIASDNEEAGEGQRTGEIFQKISRSCNSAFLQKRNLSGH